MISQVLLALILSHAGGKRNRPKWIAFSVLLGSISSFLLTVPHFIFGASEELMQLTKEYLADHYIVGQSSAAPKEDTSQNSLYPLTIPELNNSGHQFDCGKSKQKSLFEWPRQRLRKLSNCRNFLVLSVGFHFPCTVHIGHRNRAVLFARSILFGRQRQNEKFSASDVFVAFNTIARSNIGLLFRIFHTEPLC